METKHTPGPWIASGNRIYMGAAMEPREIAVATKSDPTIRESAGFNARLIAAAPDMLTALEWFVEFCDEHPEWTENELCNGRDDSAEALWLASARAAIAKATGT